MSKNVGSFLWVPLALFIVGASITAITLEKQVEVWVYLSNPNRYSKRTFYVNSCSQERRGQRSYFTVLHGFVGDIPVSRSLDSISTAPELDLDGLKNEKKVLEIPVLFAPYFKGRWKGVLNPTDDISMMNVSYASMTYLDAVILSFFCNITFVAAAIYLWSQRKTYYGSIKRK